MFRNTDLDTKAVSLASCSKPKLHQQIHREVTVHQVPRTAYLWRGKEALERLSFREGKRRWANQGGGVV